MKSNYKRLGNFIEQVNVRNEDGNVTDLRGLSLVKEFRKSTSNIVGTDMTKYKVMKQWQFSANFMGLGVLVDKAAVVLKTDNPPNIVSSAYPVFEVVDKNLLNPEYLMMWFRRSEFDRYCVFKSDKGIRGGFDWDNLCDIQLPVPSIEKQLEIVKEYNVIVNRIRLNKELIQKLEETAQSVYRHWFVDFEFPDNNKMPYKTSDGKMVHNKELDQMIPEGWVAGKLSDICYYTSERENVTNLNTSTYLSTESMLPNRGGVQESSKLPNSISTTKFNVGDILMSNIRPYFKKIWLATYSGGCSGDILCFVSKEDSSSLYLYFTIEQDLFFEYVMKGAKGTKMPRGDKGWIMEYPVLLPSNKEINHFGQLIKSIVQQINVKKDEIELLKSFSRLILSKMSKVDTLQTEQVI